MNMVFFQSNQPQLGSVVEHQWGGEQEVELATPWQRIGAYLLNNLIGMLIIVLGGVIGYIIHGPIIYLLLIYCLIPYFIFLIYQAVSMSKTGQSLGKRIVGIKVISLDGAPIGFATIVLMREVVFNLIISIISAILAALSSDLVSNVFGIVIWIACLVMLFQNASWRRTLQDYLAKTIVVKVS